ncbi:MAG: hybrid sensor histidine kinase/response regulator [Chloroflexi bacterium]|nr:MAG: hybrid sensor histidine kinase/response regulator [Chloroflexota bacterium]
MAKEKILVVDDEDDVLYLCSRVLAFDGYEVKTARDGLEAIGLAAAEQFDLLLTDIKMPGMTGLEIAQALKKHDPNLICVTMTGYSTIDMVIEALKLGIDEFITKPFTPQELSQAVAKALEKVHLRKENYRLQSLIPLFDLNKTLMGTVEPDKVLRTSMEIARKETRADAALIYTFDAQYAAFQHFCSIGVAEGSENQFTDAADTLANLVLEQGDQLALRRGQTPDNVFEDILDQLDAVAVLATPLQSQKEILGVIVLVRRETPFAPSDGEFLAVLAGQTAIALENARLFSEIQQAYSELKKLDHMKSEFINIAAHELRTPLAILMGYATVLDEDLQDSVQKTYVSHIMRNALRLKSLIDDMLNLKHLETGVITLSRDEVDLRQAVQTVFEDMKLLVAEKKLSVDIQIPADFPPMIIDRQKLDLIIVNLVHNAIKFTPAEGRVAFSAALNGSEAVIRVSDTGIGIPAEEQERIFQPFYQVEQSLTREFGGIGLGLAIVRGMTEVCGGRISVESTPGEGTTFTVTLPMDNRHLEERYLRL